MVDTGWKIISKIIHTRLSQHLQFHPKLHGFVSNKNTITEIIQAKLFSTMEKR